MELAVKTLAGKAAGNITVTARASNISTTQTANIETDVPPEEERQPDFRPLTFNPMVHDVRVRINYL